MSTLHLHDLTVEHGATTLVDVGELSLETGRPLTIVGESGSGKPLLAHAVMGTLAPELAATGRMLLDGEPYDLADRRGRRALWGERFALLPQEPTSALDPTMRVRSQVAEGAADVRSRPRDARAHADRALARVGLAHVGRSYPHTLSGGMAQRVAYAAATIGGAGLLIVDEPSKGLDRPSVDRLADLLLAHVTHGGMLITITHDLRLARRLGGEVAVMREAGIVEQGPAARVLTAPDHGYTRRLLAAEPTRWRHSWVASSAAPAGGDTLLAATGLTKRYGGTALFRDLSVRIGRAERWALTGPSGVGKTTLGNILLGLTRPDSGTVQRSPELRGPAVQKLYQDPTLAFPPHVPLGDGLGDVLRRHRVAVSRLEELLAEVGLPTALLGRRPGQVSGGELQRLAIVRAMLVSPELIFADEATSRLDPVTQERTMDCLMSEVSASGCALLMVTHDRDLAEAVTDRQLALDAGATTAEEAPVPVA